MSRVRGIRSDELRKVVSAAVDQDFRLETGGKHPVLICPVCGHPEVFTATGRQVNHEIKSKIGRLRKHGLIFKGVQASHL